MFLFFIFFFIFINGGQAQQAYVDNKQLACEINHTSTLGYTCNRRTSTAACRTYVTFRSEPPLYNTPSAIAALLRANPDEITALNNLSSPSAPVPAATPLIVPVGDCACSAAGFYQHNTSFDIAYAGQTYFAIANNTFQGLTTCQSMIAQNRFNYRQLAVGDNVTIPVRCACPTANQTAAGIRFLLTYLIIVGDSYSSMAAAFDDVDVQSILDANELNSTHIVFPFTPILIPLKAPPTGIKTPTAATPPPSPPVIPVTPTDSGGGSTSKWVFIGVGIGAGFLILLCLSGVFWFLRRRKIHHRNNLPPAKHSPATHLLPPENNSWSVSSENVRFAIESLTVYKYDDLRTATGDFTEKNRVKGSVYKGYFNGDFAAVKMMNGDVSGEINILKQINHSNIIRLSGFCLHQGNTYLVYEFAENGSLDDWLHPKNTKNDSSLGWKERVQIAYNIADALNYLHNYVNPPLIHKNLKSGNVVLDGQMRAKITNFGLARSVNENREDELQLTRHVVGTYGYMPPEYLEHGLITPKMDVFALGVLISELLSGKSAASRPPEGDKDVAVRQLSKTIKEVVGGENVREKLVGFMDGRLRGEYPVELAYSMAEIGGRCVAADLNERPEVAEVFAVLSKIMSSSLDWDPSDELEHSRSLSHGR